MQNDIAIYPTSANPPTWGHADIMKRAAGCFKKLYWVAAINPNKILDFSQEMQIEMMQKYVDHFNIKNVVVGHHYGSMVRYAVNKGAIYIIRGIRNSSDVIAEMELATGYRGINENIETICFFANPKLIMVSSSLVRQIAKIEESIDQYVLPEVSQMINDYYRKNNLTISE